MRITPKQQREISFLELYLSKKGVQYRASENDIKEFINITSKGIGKYNPQNDIGGVKNYLLYAKRNFEITSAMWIEDMQEGILWKEELREDFNHPYLDNFLNNLKLNTRYKKGELTFAKISALNSGFIT